MIIVHTEAWGKHVSRRHNCTLECVFSMYTKQQENESVYNADTRLSGCDCVRVVGVGRCVRKISLLVVVFTLHAWLWCWNCMLLGYLGFLQPQIDYLWSYIVYLYIDQRAALHGLSLPLLSHCHPLGIAHHPQFLEKASNNSAVPLLASCHLVTHPTLGLGETNNVLIPA